MSQDPQLTYIQLNITIMIKISPENLSQVSARESEKKHLQYKLYSSAMI